MTLEHVDRLADHGEPELPRQMENAACIGDRGRRLKIMTGLIEPPHQLRTISIAPQQQCDVDDIRLLDSGREMWARLAEYVDGAERQRINRMEAGIDVIFFERPAYAVAAPLDEIEPVDRLRPELQLPSIRMDGRRARMIEGDRADIVGRDGKAALRQSRRQERAPAPGARGGVSVLCGQLQRSFDFSERAAARDAPEWATERAPVPSRRPPRARRSAAQS